MKRIRAAFLVLAGVVALGGSAGAEVGELIEQRESKYNSIFVHKQGPYVAMTFGHNRRYFTESLYNPQDELDLPVAYTRYMTASLAYVDRIQSILEIGFGGGRTAWYLHKSLPETSIVSVELDPDVVALARKYFGVRDEPNFDVVTRDGRSYLMSNPRVFDIIMVDAYRGPFVPFHLLTKEFYTVAKKRLRPGGVLAQNVEPSTMLFEAAVATIGSVFQNVEFYAAGGNVVTVAYDGPRRSTEALAATASRHQAQYKFRYPLPELLRHRQLPKTAPAGKVLTDDFAPVEALRAIENHNRKWD